jgi:hypothetical protein
VSRAHDESQNPFSRLKRLRRQICYVHSCATAHTSTVTMGIDVSELVVPFSGAIQASFSVLLTILFGVIAAQCNLLSVNAAKEVSKLCVRMFLPALLIYKIGSNLHQETAVRYIPVLSEWMRANSTIRTNKTVQYGRFRIRSSPFSSVASSPASSNCRAG